MLSLVDRIPELRHDLEDVADPSKSAGMRAYMKGQFEYLGVSSPNRKLATRPIMKAVGKSTPDDLLAFAEACWDEPEREFQYVAADTLRKGAKDLPASALPTVLKLIKSKSWWDTIDTLASNTIGPMVTAHPGLALDMDVWIDDTDYWVARTAILHQLKYKEATDADRLFAYAEKRATDTEFFIRKAIGWSLREYSRIDPEAVVSFVDSHEDQLSGLSKREALRLLK